VGKRIRQLLRSPYAATKVFVTVFAAVFVIVLAGSVLFAFLLPKIYGATVRIRLEPEKGEPYDPLYALPELDVIQSDAVLGQVVYELSLKSRWGRKYTHGEMLEESDAVRLLRRSTNVRAVRNTQLVEISCYSDDPDEAPAIANAIALAYVNHSQGVVKQAMSAAKTNATAIPVRRARVEIVDHAVPSMVPVRPRKALNIVEGAAVGIVLGLGIGGVIAGIVFLLGRNARKNPA
jgi:uncharacterized protein involved in exopolysaccharide biosynthesis